MDEEWGRQKEMSLREMEREKVRERGEMKNEVCAEWSMIDVAKIKRFVLKQIKAF